MTQGQDFNCPSKITAYVSAWRGTFVGSSTQLALTQVGRKPTIHCTEDRLEHDGEQKITKCRLCFTPIYFTPC